MAIQLNASGELLYYADGNELDNVNNFTWCIWFKRLGNSPDNPWETILSLESGSAIYHYLYCYDGAGPRFSIFGVGNTNFGTITNGVWYFCGMKSNGTNLTGFFAERGATSLTTANVTGGSWGPDDQSIGGNYIYGESGYGVFAHSMSWNSVLTDAQLLWQMQHARPVVNLSTLHAWNPLLSPSNLGDMGGNGRNFLSSGTPTLDDGPALSWSLLPLIVLPNAAVSPTTISLNTATMTATGRAVTVVEGEATIALNVAGMTASGQAVTVIEGEATIALNTATSTLTGQVASIILAGADQTIFLSTPRMYFASSLKVDLTLSAAQMTLAGQPITLQLGAVSTLLNTAAMALNGIQSSIVAGEMTKLLSTGSLSLTGEASQIVPGAVSKLLATAAAQILGQIADIVPGEATVSLQTAIGSVSGITIDLVKGEAVISLSTALVDLTGQVIALVPGAVQITLSSADISSAGIVISIQSDILRALQTAQLTLAGQIIDVIPGETTVQLSTASLALAGVTASIFAGTAPTTISLDTAILYFASSKLVSIDLNTAQLTLAGQVSQVVPGETVISLSTAQINLTGNTIAVVAQTTIALNTAALTLAGQNISISAPPAGTNVALSTATMTLAGLQAAVLPGEVTISLLPAALTLAGQTISIVAPPPGSIVVSIQTATMALGGVTAAIIAGEATTTLSTAALLAAGQSLSIEADIVEQFDLGLGITVIDSLGDLEESITLGMSLSQAADSELIASDSIQLDLGSEVSITSTGILYDQIDLDTGLSVTAGSDGSDLNDSIDLAIALGGIFSANEPDIKFTFDVLLTTSLFTVLPELLQFTPQVGRSILLAQNSESQFVVTTAIGDTLRVKNDPGSRVFRTVDQSSSFAAANPKNNFLVVIKR